jgi:hypothetical protein
MQRTSVLRFSAIRKQLEIADCLRIRNDRSASRQQRPTDERRVYED